MNTIHEQLRKIRDDHRIGIMTHLVLGYPTLKDSVALARAMAEAGADFIELQIPFSDPLADGPTIMQANKIALEGGMKVADALGAMRALADASHTLASGHPSQEGTMPPLFFMTYYNIVFHYGTEQFCRAAAASGASGLIVPDVPVDEEAHEHFWTAAEACGLIAMIFLSTVSTDERMQKVLDAPHRFLYFIGQQGTTGARATLHDKIARHIERIRQHEAVSIAVGFGISKPAHITVLREAGADVAIIGSAVLNAYNEAHGGEKIETVARYVRAMVEAAR